MLIPRIDHSKLVSNSLHQLVTVFVVNTGDQLSPKIGSHSKFQRRVKKAASGSCWHGFPVYFFASLNSTKLKSLNLKQTCPPVRAMRRGDSNRLRSLELKPPFAKFKVWKVLRLMWRLNINATPTRYPRQLQMVKKKKKNPTSSQRSGFFPTTPKWPSGCLMKNAMFWNLDDEVYRMQGIGVRILRLITLCFPSRDLLDSQPFTLRMWWLEELGQACCSTAVSRCGNSVCWPVLECCRAVWWWFCCRFGCTDTWGRWY